MFGKHITLINISGITTVWHISRSMHILFLFSFSCFFSLQILISDIFCNCKHLNGRLPFKVLDCCQIPQLDIIHTFALIKALVDPLLTGIGFPLTKAEDVKGIGTLPVFQLICWVSQQIVTADLGIQRQEEKVPQKWALPLALIKT